MADSSQIIVPDTVHKERADKFLASLFADISRSRLQSAFDNGHVSVNGEIARKRHLIDAGDHIEFYLPEPKKVTVSPVPMDLEVLYEDEHMLAINKQARVVTHPGAGTGEDTLVHGVLHYCNGKLSSLGGVERPGVVHRLDKDTSGVILFAKTNAAYLGLVEAFASRGLNKQYLAMVCKAPSTESGLIEIGIKRHPIVRVKMEASQKGRHALTEWWVEKRFRKNMALLRCRIHTGRTHQIRVHLAHIGCPVVGDKTYGGYWPDLKQEILPRVMLHAESITLQHPVTNQILEIQASVPQDFQRLYDLLGLS